MDEPTLHPKIKLHDAVDDWGDRGLPEENDHIEGTFRARVSDVDDVRSSRQRIIHLETLELRVKRVSKPVVEEVAE